MLYEAYQAHSDVVAPVRWIAHAFQGLLTQPWPVARPSSDDAQRRGGLRDGGARRHVA